MRIGFVVNDVATEQPVYTTVLLAMQASNMGHEAYLMGLGDFAYEVDGALSARARSVGSRTFRSTERYLDALRADDAASQVGLSGLDVVMLRADPAVDAAEAPWASTAGVAFGQLIAGSGVLVVNDPASLASALSKAYFQHFPEAVRPRTMISRDEARIAEFVEELGGQAVLKPLQGSGGTGVFLVQKREKPNLPQIIETIARDGYVVAQEYLTAARHGDVRMFVMNGLPLRVNGKYAAFRRAPSGGEIRSNMSVGGRAKPVQVNDDMLALVDVARPKLVADGLFLVGLDIVGDKLMEVNVFSPGGLGSAAALYEENFAVAIIEDLERKVQIRSHYSQLRNADLATI